jgi:cysteine-rich repeat protein
VCGDGIVDPGEQCDDGNPVAGDGCTACTLDSGGGAHVGATWQIKNVAGQPQACPTGFDTAALVNQPIDSAGNPVGQPIIDLFDCVAGQGTSAELPATTYETYVEITDHNGTNVYAKSVPADLDVTTTDLTYNTDILTDGGYFAFAWMLTQGGAPVTCSQAGISGSSSGVELTATLISSGAATDDEFTCEDGMGVTSGLVAGDYSVSIDAFNSTGGLGRGANINQTTIQGQNQVTNLGTVTVPID